MELLQKSTIIKLQRGGRIRQYKVLNYDVNKDIYILVNLENKHILGPPRKHVENQLVLESISISKIPDKENGKYTTIINDLFLWNLWLDISGRAEEFIDTNPGNASYEIIKKRNWNQEFHRTANKCLDLFEITGEIWIEDFNKKYADFIKKSKNRMIIGFYRYGELGNQGMIDRATYLIKKGRYYHETGNKEALLDCANVAMAEWVEKGFKTFDEKSSALKITLPSTIPGALLEAAAELYETTRNPACLITIRNIALTEWVFEKHYKAHFSSVDDQDHGERRK
jgi:hypothetical protein